MYKRFLVSILTLFILSVVHAQTTYKIYGKITNNKLEPLAFVSVQLKQSQSGTITREDGTYGLTVEEGTYDLMISMVGYKPQTLKLTVTQDYQQNIILEEDDTKTMEDIVIRVKVRDRSEEIIKNVIQNKDAIQAASGPFSARLYIKAVQQDSTISKRERPKADSMLLQNPNADLTNMTMAEILLHLDYESSDRIKEQRLGVKVNGNPSDLYYLSATDGDFNFYNNLVRIPTISNTPFLSPISYSGLLAYKFKMLKIEKKDGLRNYTISVKPRQISNATVEGEITIQDSTWAILHTKFKFPSYHLPEYDYFEVEQQYKYVQNKAWMLDKQLFTYYTKSNRRKLSGQTLVTYSDYELNKQFNRRHFGVEVSATAQEAYEKDSTFWETVRTEPLTEKELRFIRYKDSIFRVTNTQAYLDSLDNVNNRVTWKKIGIFGQTFYNRKKERTFVVPPIISLYEPFQFGGGRIHPSFYYYKRYASRKDIKFFSELSYGFRNKDINGSVYLNRMYNPFNRGYYLFNLNRGFDMIYQGTAYINQIQRSSYFLNNYFAIGHGLEVVNGLTVYTEADVAFRQSLNGYRTGSLVDSVAKDFLSNNHPVPFEAYNAQYVKATLKYTPAQRYIREPKEKIILGSKWPTFYATYRLGIPGGPIHSEANYSYLEYGIEQTINVGLLGNLRYNIKSGDFLKTKLVKLLDSTYMVRGDPVVFMNPDESFQALDSTFPVMHRFYQGHVVHEFNGFFINKIPLLKKLQLREIAGGGFLFAQERNLRYFEAFAGVERVFKWPFNPLTKFKVGAYVVGSVANQFKNPIQFKLGFTTWDKKRNKWN